MHSDTDRLADAVVDQVALAVKRIGHGQPNGGDPGRCVHIGDALAPRKPSRNKARPVVVAEVFRPIGPARNEQAQVQPGRDDVLVEVEGRETARWVPTLAPPPCKSGIERI